MAHPPHRCRRLTLPFASVLVLLFYGTAVAIPEGGSMGIGVLSANGVMIGGIPVRVTHIAGNYPVLPIEFDSAFLGLVWVGVPTGTYSLVILDDNGVPIPGTEHIQFVPSAAHDILVPLYLPPTCAADLTGDGDVGVTDFLSLLGAWGLNPGGPPDFNGDGVVDTIDFLELLSQWGPCMGSEV